MKEYDIVELLIDRPQYQKEGVSHTVLEPVRFWRRNSQLFCANPYSQYVQYSFARLCLPNRPFHPPKLLRTERVQIVWHRHHCVASAYLWYVGAAECGQDAQDAAFRLVEFEYCVAKKGMFGVIMNEEKLGAHWYVIFTKFGTGKYIAGLPILEEDLQVVSYVPHEKLIPEQIDEKPDEN